MPSSEIVRVAGVDAAVYLSALRCFMRAFCWVVLVVSVIILPINATGGEVNTLMAEQATPTAPGFAFWVPPSPPPTPPGEPSPSPQTFTAPDLYAPTPPAPAGLSWWRYSDDVPPLPEPDELLGPSFSTYGWRYDVSYTSSNYHFSSLDKITLSNIPDRSDRLYAHAVIAYVVTIIMFAHVWSFCSEAVRLRAYYLATQPAGVESYSVLYLDVPGVERGTLFDRLGGNALLAAVARKKMRRAREEEEKARKEKARAERAARREQRRLAREQAAEGARWGANALADADAAADEAEAAADAAEAADDDVKAKAAQEADAAFARDSEDETAKSEQGGIGSLAAEEAGKGKTTEATAISPSAPSASAAPAGVESPSAPSLVSRSKRSKLSFALGKLHLGGKGKPQESDSDDGSSADGDVGEASVGARAALATDADEEDEVAAASLTPSEVEEILASITGIRGRLLRGLHGATAGEGLAGTVEAWEATPDTLSRGEWRPPEPWSRMVERLEEAGQSGVSRRGVVRSAVESELTAVHGDCFWQAFVAFDTSALDGLVDEYNARFQALEDLVDDHVSKLRRGKKLERPKTRVILGFRMGAWGRERYGAVSLKKVDAIDFLTSRLAFLAGEMAKERRRARERSFPAAFATFRTRYAQVSALKALASEDPDAWQCRTAPRPKDVAWRNLGARRWERELRAAGIGAAYIALVLFFMIPVSAVQALMTTNSLVSAFRDIKILNAIVTSILPGLALKIFLALVPKILTAMAMAEKIPSLAEVDASLLRRYFYFQVITVVIGSIIAGTFFNQIKQFAEDPGSIVTILGTAAPQTAVFFMNYLLVQSTITLPLGMLSPVGAVVYYLRVKLAATARAQARVWSERWFLYGPAVPNVMIGLLIGLAFCLICPLVPVFALIFLWITWIIAKYSLLYIVRPQTQSGGTIWKALFDQVMLSLIIFHIFMIAILAIKKKIGPPIMIVPLPILTVLCWRAAHARFWAALDSLSTTLASELDGHDKSTGALENVQDELDAMHGGGADEDVASSAGSVAAFGGTAPADDDVDAEHAAKASRRASGVDAQVSQYGEDDEEEEGDAGDAKGEGKGKASLHRPSRASQTSQAAEAERNAAYVSPSLRFDREAHKQLLSDAKRLAAVLDGESDPDFIQPPEVDQPMQDWEGAPPDLSAAEAEETDAEAHGRATEEAHKLEEGRAQV